MLSIFKWFRKPIPDKINIIYWDKTDVLKLIELGKKISYDR